MAYYRPLSANPTADPDTAFVGGMLAAMGYPQDLAAVPNPTPLGPEGPPAFLSNDQEAHFANAMAALEGAYDTVLVEWAAPLVPSGQPYLLVHSLAGGQSMANASDVVTEGILRLGDSVAGIVFNNAPRYRSAEVESELLAPLRARGLPALGAIPECRELLALTLGQVAGFLGGEWVAEPENLELWVDRFLIGGNIMDSGPNYFGRYSNQAVITRAGRPDIQMASLSCDTKFLVLTGGEEPTEYIRVEAQKRNAALLMVPGETLATAEALGGLLAQSNPYSQHKLATFARLADEHLEGGLAGILAGILAG